MFTCLALDVLIVRLTISDLPCQMDLLSGTHCDSSTQLRETLLVPYVPPEFLTQSPLQCGL